MQGVTVARYNLAQQPMAFAKNTAVREALEKEDVAVRGSLSIAER